MYQSFYGLSEMPFHITPDPKFLYLSRTHHDALQHLKYGISERKGFIVLTGEVGCGKTTLCRRLLEELDPERYETALILNPRLTESQLLKAILTELGEVTNARTRQDLLQELNDALLRRIASGKEIVLIIDEGQNLSFELLEQIRLLSNIETDEQKLLQIILLGQPELKEKLAQKRLRQLRQRILVYYNLNPLDFSEMAHYIQHRLSRAGADGRPRFTKWALRTVFKRSQGIPRLINNLCDRALLSAFIRQADEVTWRDARRAAHDFQQIEE